jgi:hypothetical protein
MISIAALLFAAATVSAKKCPHVKNVTVNWKQIPGGLKYVEVSEDNSLWGVAGNDEIYFCDNKDDCKWIKVNGALKQISATNDVVCGVNKNDEIYCTENCDENAAWFRLPGALKHVNINDAGNLWGVNSADQIWYCKDYKNCGWVQAPGALAQISATNEVVCGVNSGKNIYCSKFLGASVNWKQIPGSLKHVHVNKDGSLFGTNSNDEIYYCKTWENCVWFNLPGRLMQINASKNNVCGVAAGHGIYCSTFQ